MHVLDQGWEYFRVPPGQHFSSDASPDSQAAGGQFSLKELHCELYISFGLVCSKPGECKGALNQPCALRTHAGP